MENEIDEEALRRMVLEALNSSPSIENAIIEAKETKELERKSFKVCFDAYNKINEYLNNSIRYFKGSKTKVNVSRFISVMFNDGNKPLFDEIEKRIDDLLSELTKNKEVLDKTKKALDQLYKYNASSCNYDICLLFLNLFSKTELLLKEFNEDLEIMDNELEGINYISTNNFEEEIREVSEKIDNFVLRLGLNNCKLSGM